jgi:hypothetical protein
VGESTDALGAGKRGERVMYCSNCRGEEWDVEDLAEERSSTGEVAVCVSVAIPYLILVVCSVTHYRGLLVT